MDKKSIELYEGIEGLFIKNDRFNSTVISIHFFIPLDKKTVSKNALLPFLLSSCTDKYKEYTDLNIRILELYGAGLSVSVRKNGDNLHLCLSINVINDELTFNKEGILLEAADLLCSMVLEPSLCGKSFCEKDVSREVRKNVDRIEGEINNKRAFARTRLVAEMFGQDPYGLFVYGKTDEVLSITGEELYNEWQSLLDSSYIKFHVIGNHCPNEIFEQLKERFSRIARKNVTDISRPALLSETNNVNIVTEYFDVSQGKLALGYTCSENGEEEAALPHLIFSDIFGGGTYSKLFRNVREKESLCYYCSASAAFKKGYMIVDSGIDPENADRVIEAVNRELEDIQKGNIDDFEIESSKKAVYENLMSSYDNANALDFWYSKASNVEKRLSPADTAQKIKEITKEQITRAARCYKLHTIYKLLPERSVEK